jgi:predicted RND superfamily exporter protein
MTDLILRYRKAVAVLVLLMSLASVYGMLKLQSNFFRAIPLPESDPAVLANAALGDRFGGLEAVTFVLESDDVLSESSIAALRALTDDAKNLSGIQNDQAVVSLATIFEPKNDESGLSVQALLDLPPGQDGSTRLREKIRSHPFAQGLLINEAHTAALVVAYIGERSYPDPSISSDKFKELHNEEVRQLLAKHSVGDVRVSATGAVLVMQFTRLHVQREMVVIGLIAGAFVVLVFFLSFKSWRLTAMACATMFLAVLWTLGIMGWTGIPVGQCSIYAMVVTLAVGSSYAIHVISTIGTRAAQVQSKRVAIRMAISDFSLPLLTVSLAAALSGISLLSFDIPDIRELGVLQALGITLSYLLSYFLLPAAMVAFGTGALRKQLAQVDRAPSRVDAAIQAFIDFLFKIPLSRPWIAASLTIAMVGVSLIGIQDVVPSLIFEETVPRHSLPREGYERIRAAFGNFKLSTIVVQRTDGGSLLDPEGLREVEHLQRDLAAVPEIRVLPSIVDVFKQVNLATLGKEEIPARRDAIDQMLLLIGRSKLKRMIDRPGQSALLNIAIKTEDPRRMSQIIRGLQDRLARTPKGYFAQLSGTPVIAESINNYVVKNKVISIGLCLAIVLLICMIVNSSPVLGLISTAAAGVAALAIFGIMGFFGIYLDPSSATITTIAIGVGVDSAVHFLLQFKVDLSEQLYLSGQSPATGWIPRDIYRTATTLTARRYGKTIVFDALSNILGFIPLLISSFPVLKIAGLLLVVNQLTVLILTFFVTPMLILILKPGLPKRSKRFPITDELADELQ